MYERYRQLKTDAQKLYDELFNQPPPVDLSSICARWQRFDRDVISALTTLQNDETVTPSLASTHHDLIRRKVAFTANVKAPPFMHNEERTYCCSTLSNSQISDATLFEAYQTLLKTAKAIREGYSQTKIFHANIISRLQGTFNDERYAEKIADWYSRETNTIDKYYLDLIFGDLSSNQIRYTIRHFYSLTKDINKLCHLLLLEHQGGHSQYLYHPLSEHIFTANNLSLDQDIDIWLPADHENSPIITRYDITRITKIAESEVIEPIDMTSLFRVITYRHTDQSGTCHVNLRIIPADKNSVDILFTLAHSIEQQLAGITDDARAKFELAKKITLQLLICKLIIEPLKAFDASNVSDGFLGFLKWIDAITKCDESFSSSENLFSLFNDFVQYATCANLTKSLEDGEKRYLQNIAQHIESIKLAFKGPARSEQLTGFSHQSYF
ncbi:MAG: hypothetical protein CMF50_06220 [Legionellales bacterium]|nr:hypothetical protein [Legionellales bacterium]|tara:strand:- start:16 stop:1335 length:1320 start_codon:yes stop_codon:yes gene_type:complete